MDTLKKNCLEAGRTHGWLKVAMLTGDNQATAEAIAASWHRRGVVNLLPRNKVKQIAALQAEGRKVAMVGMASTTLRLHADVGIAIGTGTDVAIATAQIVSISGD